MNWIIVIFKKKMAPLLIETVNKENDFVAKSNQAKYESSPVHYFQHSSMLMWISSLPYFSLNCFNPVARGLYQNIMFISICLLFLQSSKWFSSPSLFVDKSLNYCNATSSLLRCHLTKVGQQEKQRVGNVFVVMLHHSFDPLQECSTVIWLFWWRLSSASQTCGVTVN